MWAGKYKTRHGSLIIGDEFGNIIFVSDPAPGCDHDMKKREGEVKEILDLPDRLSQTRDSRIRLRHAAKKPQDRELTRVNMNTIARSVLSAPYRARGEHLKMESQIWGERRRGRRENNVRASGAIVGRRCLPLVVAVAVTVAVSSAQVVQGQADPDPQGLSVPEDRKRGRSFNRSGPPDIARDGTASAGQMLPPGIPGCRPRH